MVEFLWRGEKVKISNLIGLFFPKGKLVEPENFNRSYLS